MKEKKESPDLSKLQEVKIDERTSIWIDKRKNPEKARQAFLERHKAGMESLKAKSTSAGLAATKAKELRKEEEEGQ